LKRAPRPLRLERKGVALRALDFRGRGPPVVLLHGLAGYGGEWTETASWLRERHRVVALDQRGHGGSTRVPATVAPDDFVGDVVAWLDELGLERACLVGQSFGGLVAFLTAGAHAERVQRLVVAEASPSSDPSAAVELEEWLESWPVPFLDREAAIRFFGGDSPRARAWAGGLETREDGLWPQFDADTLLQAVRASSSDHWDAWSWIRCPTLIVRGEHGMAAEDARAMAARLEDAVLASVPGAGHDVHLEKPAEWRCIVQRFLAPAEG
jgi:pimeloyl-ACP methyl ester carboxylesterase